MPHYSFAISSKLPRTGTTIFSKMSALATMHKAINLSQGFPGFDVPQHLKDRVTHYLQQGLNQYAPMQGVRTLREQVAIDRKHTTKVTYDPDTEVVITAGATQALFTAIMALVRENDEVIVFTPAYDCYAPAIELAGGKPIYVKLKAPDFRVDWDEVRKVVNRHTRMMIINTPHNPTGAVLTQHDLDELEHLTADSDLIVLSDEVYEHMVFDGASHLSCSTMPHLQHCTLVVGSFGKTFHATGWKVGYVAGPAELIAEFTKVHQYNVFSVNTPVQHALADFLRDEPQHVLELSAFYSRKRNLFLDALEPGRFTFTPSSGTYFQLLNYSAISKEEDTQVAVDWTVSHGVASIPISVFYHQPEHNQMLRFCFAKTDDVLLAAAERLNAI
jgi:methionine aminotransferase